MTVHSRVTSVLSEERLREVAARPEAAPGCSRPRCTSRLSTAASSLAPSEEQASEAGSVEECTESTTVILRQAPRDITRARVVQALAEQGFVAECDFLYCPLDYATRKGFGYILLNFISPEAAARFRECFRNRDASWLAGGATAAALDVALATGENRQGLHMNIERYRNSPVMHNIVPDEFKPIILSGGRRVSFPKPTEKLEAPGKLPRSVWKAWTTERTRAAPERAPAMDQLRHPVRAQGYLDQRCGLAFALPLGFRFPPGLTVPAHLQLF